jgi:hypothetical protein
MTAFSTKKPEEKTETKKHALARAKKKIAKDSAGSPTRISHVG